MAHKRIEDADYAMIAEYERQLDHLINGHYLVGVGHTAVTRLREWWQRYTGKEYAVNENCANCLADFLTMVGTEYFAEKEARKNDPLFTKAKRAVTGKTAARKAARLVKPE